MMLRIVMDSNIRSSPSGESVSQSVSQSVFYLIHYLCVFGFGQPISFGKRPASRGAAFSTKRGIQAIFGGESVHFMKRHCRKQAAFQVEDRSSTIHNLHSIMNQLAIIYIYIFEHDKKERFQNWKKEKVVRGGASLKLKQ
jgi:hypothetical protein